MIDIYKFGKFKLGLTAEEIRVYLRERLNELNQFNVYKKCPADVIRRFNKVAGINTMSCKMIKGKLVPLMYRHDVERFANCIFCKTPTYFD